MKKKKTTTSLAIAVPGLLIALIIGTTLGSCKKDRSDVPVANPVKPTLETLVGGEILQGKITAASDENEIFLTYDNGNRYVMIQKLPGVVYPDLDNITPSELILSEHGVILKDAGANTVYMLTNNDPTSIETFFSASSLLNGNIQRSLIYGTTVIKG